MMSKCRIANSLFLLLILCGCQVSPTASVPTIAPNQFTKISLLVSTDAVAYIKREGWTDYQPVSFGTFIYPTDLIRSDSYLTILCADMQTVKTMTGSARNPCPLPSPDQALHFEGMFFSSGSRGVPSQIVPSIIYPRGTNILESRPILQWSSTGASKYTIEIWQGSDLVWKKLEVKDNVLAYPAEAPELQSGEEYLLVVTDDDTGHKSSGDSNKGLGFQVIDPNTFIELGKQEQLISNIEALDTAAKKLALALVYQQTKVNGRGLWGEASLLLGQVSDEEPNAPVVFLLLGDVFERMKLWNEAQEAYNSAIIRAQELKDIESQAIGLTALWRINGQRELAQKAITLYENLGDNDTADQLRIELNP